MPPRDLIVVGGSAGSLEAITRVASGLPDDLSATLVVVIHTSPDSPRVLPELIGRSSAFQAGYARDGERLSYGRILVAPPDQHVIVENDVVRLTRGPRENRFRPSVDTLFRTAAASHGDRVIGVVLSGMLNDGTHGLLAIKRGGGVAIVQHASDALYPSMPLSAIANVPVDHVARVDEIPALLAEHVRNGARPGGAKMARKDVAGKENAAFDGNGNGDERELGAPAAYACPDCGGALWELEEPGLLRFRCRVGHGYTDQSLLTAQDENLEDALWTALRALEETAALRRRLAGRMADHAARGGRDGLEAIATGYVERAEDAEARARVIRSVLERSDSDKIGALLNGASPKKAAARRRAKPSRNAALGARDRTKHSA
ncbi:MAG TPA: chemotaxis protein CheB [Candidatus Binatia bacterium]|nr:chemotaxis protein CheB [Candidatus Binatia bacterium]